MPSHSRKIRPRIGLLVAAGVVTIAIAGGVLWSIAPRAVSGGSRASVSPTVRRSIAVLGFQNRANNADAAWVETALVERLSSALASAEQIRVVSSESIPPTLAASVSPRQPHRHGTSSLWALRSVPTSSSQNAIATGASGVSQLYASPGHTNRSQRAEVLQAESPDGFRRRSKP
jgi:hypothetical protein